MESRQAGGEAEAASRYRIELLADQHQRHDFRCGNDTLDRYLRELAGQWRKRGLAQTYVLVAEHAGERVLGYYSLSATRLVPDDLPAELARRLPRGAEIGAILLGRLAVDLGAQGRGLGRDLLFDALDRAIGLQTHVGAWAVVVDAIDEAAVAFYGRFGFLTFPEAPRRLFMPLATWAKVRP